MTNAPFLKNGAVVIIIGWTKKKKGKYNVDESYLISGTPYLHGKRYVWNDDETEKIEKSKILELINQSYKEIAQGNCDKIPFPATDSLDNEQNCFREYCELDSNGCEGFLNLANAISEDCKPDYTLSYVRAFTWIENTMHVPTNDFPEICKFDRPLWNRLKTKWNISDFIPDHYSRYLSVVTTWDEWEYFDNFDQITNKIKYLVSKF